MSEIRNFYVYAYFRPWNGEPCYVGKGQGKRLIWHAAQGINHPNKHFARIFRKAGGSLPFLKIREQLTESESFELEILLIKTLGRANEGGVLVNLTDGGEGMSGFHPSLENIRKMTEGAKRALTGKPKSESHRAALKRARSSKPGFKGKTHSEETKAKMRASRLKQPPCSEETKQKMRASRILRTDLLRNDKGQFTRCH